jgi:hypothetical protein
VNLITNDKIILPLCRSRILSAYSRAEISQHHSCGGNSNTKKLFIFNDGTIVLKGVEIMQALYNYILLESQKADPVRSVRSAAFNN